MTNRVDSNSPVPITRNNIVQGTKTSMKAKKQLRRLSGDEVNPIFMFAVDSAVKK